MSGLLWLRLVNTSMEAVSITSNVALQAAAPAKAAQPGAAAAATAAAKQSAVALLAEAASSAPRLQPPWLCDVGALQRALIQVQGPAAFDMLRWVGSNSVSDGCCIQ
jgi:hypothetical protein